MPPSNPEHAPPKETKPPHKPDPKTAQQIGGTALGGTGIKKP